MTRSPARRANVVGRSKFAPLFASRRASPVARSKGVVVFGESVMLAVVSRLNPGVIYCAVLVESRQCEGRSLAGALDSVGVGVARKPCQEGWLQVLPISFDRCVCKADRQASCLLSRFFAACDMTHGKRSAIADRRNSRAIRYGLSGRSRSIGLTLRIECRLIRRASGVNAAPSVRRILRGAKGLNIAGCA